MKGIMPVIYFDNSATTKIYPESLESYVKVSQDYFGNPSSLHGLGEVANKLLQQSRKQIADTLEVKPSEIFFTAGGSEGDNWVIKGTALQKAFYGKHIITSSIEHSAVKKSIQLLEDQGFEVTYLPVDKSGLIDLDELKAALRDDTILLSLIAVNNEIGTIQNIEAISEILADYPTVHFHLDAVQSNYVDIPLGKDSRVDMAVYSAHKFNGPRGVGFVYMKEGKQLTPLIHGGGQEFGQRSSTENLPGIVAMAKSFRLHKEKAANTDVRELTNRIREKLSAYEDVTIFSPTDGTPHILCAGIKNIRGEVTVHALEKYDIYISTTSACSSKSSSKSSALSAIGIKPQIAETAIRISLSSDNTMAEVETFLEKFDQVYQEFEVVRRSK